MGENLNSNIDPRIIFKQLPPATIIKGFVAGVIELRRTLNHCFSETCTS